MNKEEQNKIEKDLLSKVGRDRSLFIIFVITLIAFIFKYKGFPVGDSNAQLVGIYRAANPEYFKNDFYANSFSHFDVTIGFTKLINFINIPINNYEVTYMLLLFVSMFIFSVGFYKIVFLLTKNRELSLFSIILPLSVYTSRIGIGNTFELGNNLVPANFAWAIVIWSIYFYIRDKHLLSFLLLGMASIFHIVVATLIFGALFLNLLLTKKYKSLISSLSFFLLYSITTIPLFINNSKISFSNPEKVIHVLTFRSPWHYLPSTWPLIDWITFLLFFVFFLIIFYRFSKIDKEYKTLFEGFIIIILIYYLIGTVFVEIIPIKLIVKLQLFRITEFLNIIELIFVGMFFYNYVYIKTSNKTKLFLIFIALFISIIYLFFNPLLNRYEFDKDTTELYRFIRTSTPEDTILLTPPHIPTFRVGTMRAIVIDFKGVPFGEELLVEWYNRLLDVTNNLIGELKPTRQEDYSYFMSKGYNSLDENNILDLQEKYTFSYAIFEKPSYLKFQKIFENERYVLYRI